MGLRPAATFIAIRAAFWLGAAATLIWAPAPDRRLIGDAYGPASDFLFQSLSQWDARWFLQISLHGYEEVPQAAAFFPVYPAVVHSLTWVTGSELVAGVLISLVAGGIAAWVLAQLARPLLGVRGAHDVVLYFALYPVGFVFTSLYSEGLFIALAAGSFLAATRGRPLLAGVLISVANVGVVFIVGAAMLLAAAAMFGRVKVEGRDSLAPVGETETVRRLIGAGFQTIARASRPRLLVGLTVAQAFVRGCLNVLIVVAVFQVFDRGAAEVGYLTAAMGVGGLVGAAGATTLGARRLAVVFGIALVFWGLPIMLMAPGSYFGAAIVLLAIVGAANSVEDVALFTLLQRTIPDDVLTRVLGLVWGLVMGAVAIGSIAAPVAVEIVGPQAALVAVGLILPLLTLVTYRRLVEIDRAVAPAPELELIDRVPMFAPLSIALKERVAASLAPVSVAAGEIVIRAGDVGDRFYIVGGGELDIEVGGLHSAAREGDYVGEIALLRDVPRTATVMAVVDSDLYALERAAFLEAITGHSAAHAVGLEIADARLERGPTASA